MVTKEKLKDYANKLMLDMDEKEYDTLLDEFDIILKQMDLIGKIKDIDEVEPMTFPFANTNVCLREDEAFITLNENSALKNAKDVLDDQVKVPKVVE